MQQPLIWLVEDEQGIADTLIYMLQQEGFSVEAFERGLPALEKSRQRCPDAIILMSDYQISAVLNCVDACWSGIQRCRSCF